MCALQKKEESHVIIKKSFKVGGTGQMMWVNGDEMIKLLNKIEQHFKHHW